jgi:hypothetical protein
VQERQQRRAIGRAQRRAVTRGHTETDATLDAQDGGKPAVRRDIRRLRRPWRDRARTRDHDEELAIGGNIVIVGAVGQQAIERLALRGGERALDATKCQ